MSNSKQPTQPHLCRAYVGKNVWKGKTDKF